MTIENLQNDLVVARKSSDRYRVTALSNMIDAVKKASITSKGRVEITEQLISETLTKYQKIVQEQYDSCPDTTEYSDRKQKYLTELNIVKEYAPQLLTDYNEIKELVVSILSEYGPVDCLSTNSNRGAVMKIVAPAMRGKADMSIVNKVVGDLLS